MSNRLVRDGGGTAVAVVLLVVVTAAVLLLSTRLGIGVSADGTAYLGFRPHDVGHAPLYSGLMRVLALLPFDVAVLARLYHVAVYAATAAVSWQLLHDATGRVWPAWAGALLIAFTGQALALYSMALSEPTFVLLVVLSFWMLSSWVDTHSPRLFVGAAVAAALATLARYPGIALVATGALTAFAAGPPGVLRRCARAAAFGSIGALPAVVWMAYVARESGTAGGRQAAFAGTADAGTFYDGLLEAARYLLPTELPVAVRIAALALALAVLAVAALVFYRRAPVGEAPIAASGRHAHRYLPLILIVFAAMYSALVVLAVLVEPYLPISDRYLYPLYVALVLLGATTVPALARTTVMRRVVAVGVVGFVALCSARAAKVAGDGFEEGWGYAAEAWRSSAAVAFVKDLPSGTAIYSDDPFALLYLTHHEVERVPNAIVRRQGIENANFEQEIAGMRERLRDTDGVVVIFERSRGQFVAPVLPKLIQSIPLEEQVRLDDATVYTLAAPYRYAARGEY